MKLPEHFNLVPMKRLSILGFLFSIAIFVLYSCQKELSQESNLNNASYSLHDDSTLSCFPIAVSGTYYDGVAIKGDTNYVKVVVNVKSTGNYAISSITKNGFSFADSGFFSKTGIDTLILKAVGTPILIQPTEFTLNADTLGDCGFSVDVQDSTGTGLGGEDTTGTGGSAIDTSYTDPNPATDSSWHFTDSVTNVIYSGSMGIAGNSFIDSSGTYILTLAGFTSDFAETFGFRLYSTNPEIQTGVYPITGNNTLGYVETADLTPILISNELFISEAPKYSYINITSYDATTKHIQGVLHTWAIDGSTGELKLLKGSFNTYFP